MFGDDENTQNGGKYFIRVRVISQRRTLNRFLHDPSIIVIVFKHNIYCFFHHLLTLLELGIDQNVVY